MLKLLLVGCGGFAGSVLRYLVSGWVHQLVDRPGFPWGTLAVNVLGCFAIGLASGLAESRQILSAETRLFLLIGVLGGFTTFSTFGYETTSLLAESQRAAALANVVSQVVFGIAAVYAGQRLVTRL